MSLEANLLRVLTRHEELQHTLSLPGAGGDESFARLSREFAELGPVVLTDCPPGPLER